MHRGIVWSMSLIFSFFRCRQSNWAVAMALLIAVVLSATQTGQAQTIDWANTTGTPNPWYQFDGNWTGGIAPDSTETARFDQADVYDVWWDAETVSTAPEVEFLDVLDGDVTFRKKGGGIRELIILGSGGTGSFSDFSITGSSTTLTNRSIYLRSLGGAQITDGATFTLDGSQVLGTKLSIDGAVGFQVDGNLNVEAGSLVSNMLGYVGHSPGSTGEATVSGIGSEWNNSSALYVGFFGDGTLNVEAGGAVSSFTGFLGSQAGSTGVATVTGSGSQWYISSYLRVGYRGNGTLNIEAGGVVSNVPPAFSNSLSSIGSTFNSTGLVTVTGSGSQWNNASTLYVGSSGNGTLNVEAGGVVTNSDVYLGFDSSSTGMVTVEGSSSQWSSSNLSVGYAGIGTLKVEAGGVVSNKAAILGFYRTSTGVAMISGSGSQWNTLEDISVGSSGNGTLNIEAGGLVSSEYSIIAHNSSSIGIAKVTGNGSQWNTSKTLFVGYSGTGKLNIEVEGQVTNSAGVLGNFPNSTGMVTVTGSGSQWSSSDLYVGFAGDGMLNVVAGGLVSNDLGYLGSESNSTGVATVTGSGSQWNNSSSLTLGDSGTGILNVVAGGQVSNSTGYLGLNSGSSGVATVSGSGSLWDNSSYLRLGKSGTGILNVVAGGQVNNSTGHLGLNAGSSGVATVSGSGSQWNNSSTLIVGLSGTGILNVVAGGQVSNTYGFIGWDSGSTGMATVSGSGSQWINSESFYVGGSSSTAGGIGTLNIQDSGLVSVANTLKIWETGTVNLDGGTVRAGTLDPVAGAFNWTAGELNVDNYTGNLVQDAGTLEVGNTSNTTAIAGDYLLSSGGVLEIGLANSGVAGTDFELLEVAGDAVLGGVLDVLLTGGFMPAAGDTFEILTAASVSGMFDTINLPALPDDLLWFVNYGATSVELVSTYAADFNEDGLVDAADRAAWKGGFGSGLADHGDGDANANAVASGIDFLSWQRQFSSPVAPLVAAVFVPEPTSLALACFAVLGVGACRGRKRVGGY